jgi:hypothetical protein
VRVAVSEFGHDVSVLSCTFPGGEIEHPSPWLGLPLSRDCRIPFDYPIEPGTLMPFSTLPLRGMEIVGRPFGWHYKVMRKLHGTLSAFINQMKAEVLSSDWQLRPGADSPLAHEIREFTHKALYSGPFDDLEAAQLDLLDAIPDGFACLELRWEELTEGKWKGKWTVRSARDRDMWHFAFLESEGEPVFCVRTARGKVPAPRLKFLEWACGGGGPWGNALLDDCYTEFLSAVKTRHYQDIRNGKWAQPAGGVETEFIESDNLEDETKKENAKRLREAETLAKNLHSNAALAWDKNLYTPRFLGVQMPGDSSYQQTLDGLNRVLALLIRGEVNTSGLRPGTGAKASDEVVVGVARVYVKLRINSLKTRLNQRLLRPLAEINWGRGAPAAEFRTQVISEAERQALMEGIRLANDFGRPTPESYLGLVSAVPDPAPGEKTCNCVLTETNDD